MMPGINLQGPYFTNITPTLLLSCSPDSLGPAGRDLSSLSISPRYSLTI